MKVKSGNVVVRLFASNVGGRKYWEARYKEGGKIVRRRVSAKTEKEAKVEAGKIADSLADGQRQPVTAIEAEEIRLIKKRVPGVSVESLIQCWEKNHAGITDKDISEVITEMLAEKRQAGLSSAHLTGLGYRLAKVAEAIPGPISGLTLAAIETFLTDTKGGYHYRESFIRSVSILANYAKRRGYLSREWHEVEKIPRHKPPTDPIEIYTPDELRKLLAGAKRKHAFYLAMAALTGIRQSELLRLDWSNIGESWITVPAAAAKTAARRLVPVLPSTAAWIAWHGRGRGKVFAWHPNVITNYLVRHGAKAGIPWRKNALRHSYISYRVAEVQDVPKVALEAGNSPAKIFRNYRELVTPQQALEWFSITPENLVTKSSQQPEKTDQGTALKPD